MTYLKLPSAHLHQAPPTLDMVDLRVVQYHGHTHWHRHLPLVGVAMDTGMDVVTATTTNAWLHLPVVGVA